MMWMKEVDENKAVVTFTEKNPSRIVQLKIPTYERTLDKDKDDGRKKLQEGYDDYYDNMLATSARNLKKNLQDHLEKDWEISVDKSDQKYFLNFKSSQFTISERIRIIEAALEDIRERYIHTKYEFHLFNRRQSKIRRRYRNKGTS